MANENKKWNNASEALDFVLGREKEGKISDELYAEALAVVNAEPGAKEAYESRKKVLVAATEEKKDRETNEQQILKNAKEAEAQVKAEAEEHARQEEIEAQKMDAYTAYGIVTSKNARSHPRYDEALAIVLANPSTNQAYNGFIADREREEREAQEQENLKIKQEEMARLREIQRQEALAAAQKAEEEREKAAAKSEEKQAKDAPAAKTEAVKVDAKTPAESKGVVKGAAEKTEEKMTPERALYLLKTQGMSHPDYGSLLRLVVAHPAIYAQYKRFLEERQAKSRQSKEDVAWVNAVIQNKEDMIRYGKDYYPSSYAVQKKDYITKIFDRVDFYETDEKTGHPVLPNVENKEVYLEKKKNYLNLLFEKSKLEVMTSLLEDKDYMKLSDKDKKEKFRLNVDNQFFANVARIALSSSMPAPTDKELKMDSPEQSSYVKRLSSWAQSKVDDLFDSNKRLAINADHVLISVADTANKVEDYCAKLKEKAKQVQGQISAQGAKKLGEAIDYVNKKKTKLENRADEISGGRYKKFAKWFRENKFKIGSNALATIALTLSGYGTAALVVYGLYMAADSFISPIVNEALKIKEQRKEAKLPPLGSLWEYLHQARVKLAGSKKEGVKGDPKYWRRAIATSAIAVVSFGALASAAPAMQAAGTLRKGFSLVKMGISNMAQATETGITGVNALKHKDDEIAQKEFKSALKSLGIGLAAAGVSFGGRAIVEHFDAIKEWVHGISEKVSSAVDKISSGNGGSPVQSAGVEGSTLAGSGNTTPVENIDSTSVGNGTAPGDTLRTQQSGIGAGDIQADVEIERFPTEWNKNMGISEKYYKIWRARLNNGEISGFDPQSLDRAYINMDNEVVSGLVDKTRLHEMLEKGIIDNDTYMKTSSLETFPAHWDESMGITKDQYDTIMSNTRFRSFYDLTELVRNGHREQYVLGNAETGYYIKTPTARYNIVDSETAASMSEEAKRHVIVDDGILKRAKSLAPNEKLSISRLHGRSFLQDQFENVKIEGMTNEKMQKVIDIAMKTYDHNQVSGATAQIKELFPDLSKDQLNKVYAIVDYNRAYEQNGELIENMYNTVNCKEGTISEKGRGLLLRTNAILKMSKGNANPLSENPGCPSHKGMHVHKWEAVAKPETEVQHVRAGVEAIPSDNLQDTLETKAESVKPNMWGAGETKHFREGMERLSEDTYSNDMENQNEITEEECMKRMARQEKIINRGKKIRKFFGFDSKGQGNSY